MKVTKAKHNIHRRSKLLDFPKEFQLAISSADISQLHRPEAPEAHPHAETRRWNWAATGKHPPANQVMLRPSLFTNSGFLRNVCGLQNREHSVHLETNLFFAVFICSISSCPSGLHSRSYTLVSYKCHSELVACYVWMPGVAHSFSPASLFIIPAGFLSSVISG